MRTKSTIDDETTTKQNLQNQISELLQINLSKVEKELVLKQSQLNAIEVCTPNQSNPFQLKLTKSFTV